MGVLIPFFIMFFFIVSKFKVKINFKDKKLIFLLAINIVPIILMFLTSLFMGAKIRNNVDDTFLLISGGFICIHISKKNYFKQTKILFLNIFGIIYFFSNGLFLYFNHSY